MGQYIEKGKEVIAGMESAQGTSHNRLVVKRTSIQIKSQGTEEWQKGNWLNRKGGETNMELLKRLVLEEDGQGLVEYTLIVLLVALVFWVGIKSTNIGGELAAGWSKITVCVSNPAGCTSSS